MNRIPFVDVGSLLFFFQTNYPSAFHVSLSDATSRKIQSKNYMSERFNLPLMSLILQRELKKQINWKRLKIKIGTFYREKLRKAKNTKKKNSKTFKPEAVTFVRQKRPLEYLIQSFNWQTSRSSPNDFINCVVFNSWVFFFFRQKLSNQ